MWSDFSAISGNLREFAQLQMKKEKERRGLFGQKKRESSIIRILKKREEKEGDGFFCYPSLLTAILLIEKLCSRQDHCADSILKAEDYIVKATLQQLNH